MKRRAFLHAINNVVNNLVNSQIVKMIRASFETKRSEKSDKRTPLVDYAVLLDYVLTASKFGPEENAILEIMDLKMFSDPRWWQEFEQMDIPQIYPYIERANFAIKHLPLLARLLKQEHIEESPDGTEPSLSKDIKGKSLLTVSLVENHDQFSSPSRLIFLLEAVNLFYDALATLHKQPNTDLAVLAIDSGSDKSFDFLGLAKVMDSVKDLILGIWDRRLFHRNQQISQCVETIANSLPVIEQIHQMKIAGTLEPEQAEILKRQLIEGTTKFLQAGAVISEMSEQLEISPRSLMRPEQKMLAGPGHASSPDKEQFSDETYEVESPNNDDEIARLEALLKRAKGKSSND